MQSLRQAFNNAWQAAGPTSVCDMCPLHHLHQLCVQLEGMCAGRLTFSPISAAIYLLPVQVQKGIGP